MNTHLADEYYHSSCHSMFTSTLINTTYHCLNNPAQNGLNVHTFKDVSSKEVSVTGTSNCIPHDTTRCDYSSMPNTSLEHTMPHTYTHSPTPPNPTPNATVEKPHIHRSQGPFSDCLAQNRSFITYSS